MRLACCVTKVGVCRGRNKSRSRSRSSRVTVLRKWNRDRRNK